MHLKNVCFAVSHKKTRRLSHNTVECRQILKSYFSGTVSRKLEYCDHYITYPSMPEVLLHYFVKY